jgi:Skp family chaperone for outer membrane proteins
MLATMLLGCVLAQSADAVEPEPAEKVAVVQLARVMQQDQQFLKRRDDMEDDLKAIDEGAVERFKAFQQLEAELKEAEGDEALGIQSRLKALRAADDVIQKSIRKDYLERESLIYRDAITRMQKAVASIAEREKLTLVIFVRPDQAEGLAPQFVDAAKVIRPPALVYFRNRDRLDITDAVIRELQSINKQRSESSKAP